MDRRFSEHGEALELAKSSPTIAVIGCGAIAEKYYLPALAKHKSVLNNLILVDPDLARAKSVGEKFGVGNTLSDFRKIDGIVDCAIVSAPTDLHYPISMECLSRGIHVLCEKPLAESADRARQMVEEARKSGVMLAANYLQRLYASFSQVQVWIQKKSFGDPLFIRYLVGEEFDWPSLSGFYFNGPLSSRGILRDRGAHVLDHICWWLGSKPKLISCENDSRGGSDAVALIRFEHGKCAGEVKLSWLCSLQSQFTVECEKGTISGDVYEFESIQLQDRLSRNKRIRLKSGGRSKSDVANTLISQFLTAVITGEKPLISGADVLPSIEFIDECYAAATQFDMPWYRHLEVLNDS